MAGYHWIQNIWAAFLQVDQCIAVFICKWKKKILFVEACVSGQFFFRPLLLEMISLEYFLAIKALHKISSVKFIYSEKPQNFAKSPPYFWLALHRTKVRWRFRKILRPSQNISTSQTVTVVFALQFFQIAMHNVKHIQEFHFEIIRFIF